MKKLTLSLFISMLTCIAFISCAGPYSAKEENGTALEIAFPSSRATYVLSDVTSYSVTIKSQTYSETKTGNPGDTITFSGIPVGTYSVEAVAKKFDGGIVAKNTTPVTAIIQADKITQTSITLSLLNHWTVEFKKNDGTTTTYSWQDILNGEFASMPAGIPTWSGKTFKGWSTTSNGSVDVNPSTLASTPVTSNTCYYAIWQ